MWGVSLPSGRFVCVGTTRRRVYFSRKSGFLRVGALCRRTRCSLLHTALFWHLYAGGVSHYPRRALHAVETLDAQELRRLICRFYATAVLALCGLNIPSAGTHATPAPNRAHSSSQGETGGVSGGGRYHYPRTVSHGSEPLRAQRSEEHTLPSLHGPRERRREAESLRNGDAHRARLRSEAPRPRRAALLRCCILHCTDELRDLSSMRRSAEAKCPPLSRTLPC